MRIALLFSGQPRVVDGIVFKSIQTVFLSRYDVDVYAHFWDYADSSKTNTTARESIQKFKNQYSPKAIVVDPPLTDDEYSPNAVSSYQKSSYSMYASMKRVYTLFEATADTTYDWIVRIRADSVIYRCPDLTTLPRGYIYVPDWHAPRTNVVVNHTIIMTPEHAKWFFSINDTFQHLKGPFDEDLVHSHFEFYDMVKFRRALSMNIFYPTFSRDGIVGIDPPSNGDRAYRVIPVGDKVAPTKLRLTHGVGYKLDSRCFCLL